jgi:hypothetical protein
VIQQGQVFKLKGGPRMGSRCGLTGIASQAAARRGCRWPGSAAGRSAEGASEQAGPAGAGRPFGVDDVGKLRWLLGKATAELGEVRPAEVSPQQVCAWRLRVPKGTASKRRRHSDRC